MFPRYVLYERSHEYINDSNHFCLLQSWTQPAFLRASLVLLLTFSSYLYDAKHVLPQRCESSEGHCGIRSNK